MENAVANKDKDYKQALVDLVRAVDFMNKAWDEQNAERYLNAVRQLHKRTQDAKKVLLQ